MQPASALLLRTTLRHPAMAAATLGEAFPFEAAWVSCFFWASSLFHSWVFRFLGWEQLRTGVENSSSLALPQLSCGPLETIVLKGDIITWHWWWTCCRLRAEGLTSSMWEFSRSLKCPKAFRAFGMLVSWARSPCSARWIQSQMWSKPSEGTGDASRRRDYILHVYSWGFLLSLLSCWLLYRAEIEGTVGHHPGEAFATGASVLWGGRKYLKSTTLLLEGEQLLLLWPHGYQKCCL